MTVTVTLQQANRFTLARHGLLTRTWRDPVAAAGNLCGLHAQVPTTPALSLWCRLTDFDPRTLDDALYRQRSLVKRWFMRGTLHLVPASDFPVYHCALRRAWGNNWGRYLARRQHTTPAGREARLYPAALAALHADPLSRQTWRDRVQAQLDPAQPVPLRLLPRFDPLLLGHKDKARLLSPAHRPRSFAQPAK